MAVEEHVSRVGLKQTRYDAQQGGLAGAVATEESHSLAAVDGKVNVGEHLPLAESLADMFYLQNHSVQGLVFNLSMTVSAARAARARRMQSHQRLRPPSRARKVSPR